MAKLEIAVRQHGENAGKSLIHRINENGVEEYMVLLRQKDASNESEDEIQLYAHNRYVYAHYNADLENIRSFLKKLNFEFPKSYNDSKGKDVPFKSVAEQFEVLGAQGFVCESKSAAWDIVRVRTTNIPDEKEPACTGDGEVLYLHEPVDVKPVLIAGKTYYTANCGISTDDEGGKEYYETKKIVKNAAALIVYTRDVADWGSHRTENKVFTVSEPVGVEENGLI